MSTVIQPIRALVRPISLTMREVEVELSLPAGSLDKGATLALPVWTPGSYLVRDYARFLDRVRIVDVKGRESAVEKSEKHRWVLPARQDAATLRYRLFCNELTVRTNHVDDQHAFLLGAASFPCLEGQEQRPWEIQFEGWPKTWRVATALPGKRESFHARDYDTLVDAPFELGSYTLHRWRHEATLFEFAITGKHPADEARIIAGTQRIVETCGQMFGGFPFKRYLFQLTFSPGLRGGLEHCDSTSLIADPQKMGTDDGYTDLFLLIAHEFFHCWNVKRMRDHVLGPFDYGRENHTRLLWFHEGFTSFMQYVIATKAGVAPWSFVASKLASLWTDNTTRAGRLEQSLEESSLDAWIRHYKPNEFSANSTVSYYEKGAMVAWIMEANLRLATRGEQGVEDLFRHLWHRFGDGHLGDGDIRDAYQALSGEAPAPFWKRFIQGTAEVDAHPIEQAFGLQLRRRAPWEAVATGSADAIQRAKVYTGLCFNGDQPKVAHVLPGSPAADAGLSYGHEILAVDGWRCLTAQDVQNRFKDVPPGTSLDVIASDRGVVRHYHLTTSESPMRETTVLPAVAPSRMQRKAFKRWMGLDHPAAPTKSRKR